MPRRPERPSVAEYYERDRVEFFSQGDVFRDVPLAYPLPANELVVDEESAGSRLEGQRVSQLAYRGAQQLQRKLVWFYSGWLEDDLDVFDPPMD